MSTWILKTNNFKVADIEGVIIDCKKNAIVMMSLKKLSIYWALAIFCILIPVLHFILTPLFFVVGLMAFFSQYKNSHFLQTGFYVCPLCLNRVEIKKIYLYQGMKWNCNVCMEQMKLEQKS